MKVAAVKHWHCVHLFILSDSNAIHWLLAIVMGHELVLFAYTFSGWIFVVLNDSSQAEVSNLAEKTFTDEDVCSSQVSVNVVLLFDVRHAFCNLMHKNTRPLSIIRHSQWCWTLKFCFHTPCFIDILSSLKIFMWLGEYQTPVIRRIMKCTYGRVMSFDLVQACMWLIRTWAPKSISLGSCIFLPGGLFKKSNKLPDSKEQRIQTNSVFMQESWTSEKI